MSHVRLPSRTLVTIHATLMALFFTVVTAGGCSSSNSGSSGGPDGSTTDSSMTTDATMGCPNGQMSCSGSCVNVQNDPHNCGTCGATCGGGLVCASGECSVSCPMAKPTNCSGACSNTQTDFDNCGMCGNTCQPGQVCNMGMCGNVCSAPTKDCSGSCVDETSDPANCGACGNACGKNLVCASSVCATSCGTLTTCLTDGGSYCTNTASDNLNCGTCGTVCTNGELCSSGKCVVSCPTGQINCGVGGCVDANNSTQYCGATLGCGIEGGSAGNVCAQGQACVNGMCQVACMTGQIGCPNVGCVDPKSSNQFCGASLGCGVGDAGSAGTDCTNGTVCSNGSCQATCGSGLVLCSVGGTPTCVDPTTNGSFCGATTGCGVGGKGSAGTTCTNGNVCSSGSCSPTCGNGQVLCDGMCVDPTTNPFWCGAVAPCAAGPDQGQICQTGHVCTNGNCEVTCAPTQALCGGSNGTCIDPETSPLFCGATVGTCANPGQDCTSTAQGFGPGWVCSGGPSPQCILSCQAGLVDCLVGTVQTCIDPLTDPSFCGATVNPGDGGVGSATSCGQGSTSGGANCANAPYGAGFSCVGGNCELTCLGTQAKCLDPNTHQLSCVDPTSDTTNCGATGGCGLDGGTAGYNCVDGGNGAAGSGAGWVCTGTQASNSVCSLNCQTGQANCGGTCTNGQSSLTHCGAVGVTAGNTGGACSCGWTGETACTGGTTDPNYAGVDCTAGGTKTGFACVDNVCTLECAAGLARCDYDPNNPASGTCIDPVTSTTHCGATPGGGCNAGQPLGSANYPGEPCVPGSLTQCGSITNPNDGGALIQCVNSCLPLPAQTACINEGNPPAAYCANQQTDNNNCGACGTVCSSLTTCGLDSGTYVVASDGGVTDNSAAWGCNSTCLPNQTACLNPEAGAPYCAYLATDINNCGTSAATGCGNVCQPIDGGPTVCSGGVCKANCDPGLTNCSSNGTAFCANTTIDVNNCGNCGVKCNPHSSTPICVDSVCCGNFSGNYHSALAANNVCGGQCTNTLTDSNNCGPAPPANSCSSANGGTGTVCGSGSCTNGVCDTLVSSLTCPSGTYDEFVDLTGTGDQSNLNPEANQICIAAGYTKVTHFNSSTMFSECLEFLSSYGGVTSATGATCSSIGALPDTDPSICPAADGYSPPGYFIPTGTVYYIYDVFCQ